MTFKKNLKNQELKIELKIGKNCVFTVAIIPSDSYGFKIYKNTSSLLVTVTSLII